jgi:NADPH:quinone reductase-like Zn-dependent oxidoreductase
MFGFIEQHRLEPLIERSFSLESAAAALSLLQEGHRIGKIVITTS